MSDDPSQFRQRDDTSFDFDNLSDSKCLDDGVLHYDKYYSMPSQRYVKHLSTKYGQNAIEYLPPIVIDWHNVDSPQFRPLWLFTNDNIAEIYRILIRYNLIGQSYELNAM